jgi:hypothetical protein
MMLHDTLRILFVGELSIWMKVEQAFNPSAGSSIQFHRATSLREAMRCLAEGRWEAILVEFNYPPAKELLTALQLHSVFHAVPAIGLLAFADPHLDSAAVSAGATSCLAIDEITAESIRNAVGAALNGKKSNGALERVGQMEFLLDGPGKEPVSGNKIEIITHALNNLLCIISANADILADKVDGSQPAVRSLDQIKKATKTATELIRHLQVS